jgi:predicted Rossmann fold nucleotide-binding protein DprA/Smf involved in DNA uptake
MPSTSNAVSEMRAIAERRLAEIEEEREQLVTFLGGATSAATSTTTARRGPGRPRGTGRGPGRPRKDASASKPATRKRRRRRGGTRADQAVKLVEDNPGISASEIAKQMKIKPNYLYRVLGEMEKEGRVTKKGREYHPSK